MKILQAAKDALEACDGDWHAAAKLLRQQADADQTLQLDLTYPLIDQACWDVIRKAGAGDRRSFFAAASGNVGGDNTDGIAEASKHNWYKYPLPGGKSLGDASQSDLLDAADMHNKFASTNLQRANFFMALSAKVGKRKTVSDVLSCIDIERLACSTMKAAD